MMTIRLLKLIMQKRMDDSND